MTQVAFAEIDADTQDQALCSLKPRRAQATIAHKPASITLATKRLALRSNALTYHQDLFRKTPIVSRKDLALVILINLIWGFNVIAAKYGVDSIPPVFFTFLRFVIVAIVLIPFLRIHRGQMRAIIFVSMATGGLHFALTFTGLALAKNVSSMAVAMQLGIPFGTILSIVFLGERIGALRWLGLAMAFGGIVVVGFDPQVFDQRLALMLVVIGALFAAGGLLVAKKLAGVSVFQLQAWIAMISWPTLLVISLVFETHQLTAVSQAGPLVWLALLYTAIAASLLGHGGMYYLIQRYDLSMVMPTFLLATVFAIIFSVTLLGDVLGWRVVLGASLTLSGVLLILKRRARRRGDRNGASDTA